MREGKLKSAVRTLVPRAFRNWLRSPQKAASWIWQSTRFKLGASEEFPISNGQALRLHPLAYRAAVTAQVRDPEQAAEFQQFLGLCHPGMFLFDIGASFGIFSLACAKLGGNAIAADPSHIAIEFVRAQSRLNNVQDSVRALEAPAGEIEGTIEMLDAGIFSDGYFRYEPGRDHRELKRVPMITVDGLCSQYGEPSHLKIDVEGYEEAVIRGARHLLSRSSPLVFLEIHNELVHEQGRDCAFCLDELIRLGYSIFSVQGAPLSREEALQPPIRRFLARRDGRPGIA